MSPQLPIINSTLNLRFPSVFNVSSIFIVLSNHTIEYVHQLFEVRYLVGQLVHDPGDGHHVDD